MITLYQFEISPFCDKIRRVLNYKKQPYRLEEIPLSKALTQIRKVNPIGKVPCLDHDGRLVADSTEIARYLEATFPEPRLIPADPKLRALAHVVEDWADESLYFYEVRLRFMFPHNAERWLPRLAAHDSPWLRKATMRLVPVKMKHTLNEQGIGRKPDEMFLLELERHVQSVADLLGDGAWLVGDALSLADISVFSQLACIRGADEGARLIDACAPVARWMERVDEATAAGAAAA